MFLVRVSSVNGFDAVSASGGGSEHPVEQLGRISVRTLSRRLSCTLVKCVVLYFTVRFLLFFFVSVSQTVCVISVRALLSSSTLVITHCKLGTVLCCMTVMGWEMPDNAPVT